jgi:hypothetical protein
MQRRSTPKDRYPPVSSHHPARSLSELSLRTSKAQARPGSQAVPGPLLAVPDSPAEFARTLLHFHPDPIQTQILESRANRGIINCTRQWGKSTLMAILALHTALREPGSLILMLGPSSRQSGELAGKVSNFLSAIDVAARGDRSNRLSLVLPNGSRLVALPAAGNRLRGFSAPRLVIIDEAAYVDDKLYTVLRPMLVVSRGDLWLLSTPNGDRGFFYTEWTWGGDIWQRFSVPAADCARFDPAWLERERESMSPESFAQEYACAFLPSRDRIFSPELLERVWTDEVDGLEI